MRNITLHKNAAKDVYHIFIDSRALTIGVTRSFSSLAITSTKAELDRVLSQFFIWADEDLLLWAWSPLTDQEKSRIKILILQAIFQFTRKQYP